MNCDDFVVSRRRFLAGASALLGGVAVSGMVGDIFTQTAYGAPGSNTLVVLSLRGGCDGLSLIAPHGDARYAAARPTIALPTGSLLAKDSMFGLHPEFKPLLPMWQAGTFGAVHAVGLPAPNRSHFSAMEQVEDADPGSSSRVGWLNRMIGRIQPDVAQEGMQIGSPLLPTSLVGPASAVSTRQLSDLKLPGGSTAAEQNRTRAALSTMWGKQASVTGKAARAALQVSKTMAGLAKEAAPANGATYPAGDLGKALAAAARVIRAGVGVRVITLDYGGWDHHTDLGTLSQGEFKTRVAELAKSAAAFFTDLGSAADKVTMITMSEFGRGVTENGVAGTEHGYGNAMLLLGAGVRGGRVHGKWPGLGAGKLVDGDLAVTTDYRQVLSDVVKSRFPEASLAAVFPGFPQGASIGAMR
jgi:uncharacterized protein (DUF1501 family)